MLRATFQHLVRGISADKEAALWRKGVLSWEDFEKTHTVQRALFQDSVDANSLFSNARAALHAEDAAFFANCLGPREKFRIPLSFPNKTIFLDIESTGLSRYYDIITMVGWSYQGCYGACIRGQDDRELRAAMQDAEVIVTFNGSLFDIPFLRVGYPDLKIPPVHIDLRFLAKRVGLTGGQKLNEEVLGFKRPAEIADIRGEAAPILWHRYRRGNLDALKLLIEYNHSDIEGMKYIFDKVVAKLLKERKVPKRVRDEVPLFACPTRLSVINGKAKQPQLDHVIQIFPYEGPVGPAIKLSDLSPQRSNEPLRVVGIDLTGSEARPSGWCLLAGDEARTSTVGSDEELIRLTMEAKPHLVSIDSPLSLPYGRATVFDDDPGRQEFGIMRQSERALKKRGINVYPALIPSMQRLTARGINLAMQFRALGIPVIESYPGAAQDIMGIPRKRAGLEMLRDGLGEFGVTGEYLRRTVTHDELDAITSAVVGIFFWSGRFEALGSQDEEALVIPDPYVDARPWLERQVIGISGPVAAGKTTASRHLESLGFVYTRYSMVLQRILEEHDQKVTRIDLQKLGEHVHNNYGQRWLGRRLLETLPKEGHLVIDGLRFPDDHAFLLEAFGPAFRHVHITAPEDTRNARYKSNEGRNKVVRKADTHPIEKQVSSLATLAHIVLANDDNLESLHGKLNASVRF